MVRGVFDLLENGRNNFTPGGQETRIRRWAIVLYDSVQLRQRVVGHQREHVMLDVIVHVPVQIPMDRIHVHRPAIETVIEDILGQASMLCKTVDNE